MVLINAKRARYYLHLVPGFRSIHGTVQIEFGLAKRHTADLHLGDRIDVYKPTSWDIHLDIQVPILLALAQSFCRLGCPA